MNNAPNCALKSSCMHLLHEMIAITVIRGGDPFLYVEAILDLKMRGDDYWEEQSQDIFGSAYKIVFELIRSRNI